MRRLLRPAIFLDRDGTLNRQVIRDQLPYPPATLEEFELLPGVAEGCRRLHFHGYDLVVVTNQPDVGRGTLQQSVVEAMHARLLEWVPQIARIEVCYDSGRGEPCRRRKPEPGMVLDAAQELGLELRLSWMIGDRWRDIDCAQRAGLRSVLIDYGYREPLQALPNAIVSSFTEAVEAILNFGLAEPKH